MRAMSTADVPLEVIREFRDEVGGDLELTIDESQMFYRSAEPPSWLVFLAEADWWVKALAAYGALFVAKIVEEAAKDTWKNRGKLLAAGVNTTNRLKRLAAALFSLRQRLAARTHIEIGLPIPDNHFATRLELIASDPDNLAIEIALFVHHLPALVELVDQERLFRGRVAAGIHLQLRDDGSLQVSWQDGESFQRREHVLPLKADSAA